ncbi:hypothetical protein SSP24_30050 [Streptomyces spinoverrucosus]|uniref:Uncharacterized protein n=1 Tax=Streptomyces spinoverrucosus TaxID=284043 RepID=A0A4Y3VHR0_9ACTN|nr:hypothetical protein [Streptomyces spinoverrucosus]GEC05350.1 hypothetical protein SSP24_30050 [Streptomyces spinoverrucosus]GHB78969.1 hypothetical protein GCM10010397_57000 [Streptomyces spinoverrucosus]
MLDHTTHGTHLSSVAAMALSGLVPTAVVPGVMSLVGRAPLWERVSLPPGVALPLLVLLHAWVVLADLVHPLPAAVTLGSELVLLSAAVTFWVPVVAYTRHRLSDPGRCLYLFLAAPLLDLPALGVIAAGHSAEGVAMIVGMLPLGIAAAALTWSWILREERQARMEAVQAGGPPAR